MARAKGQPFSTYTEPSFQFWFRPELYTVHGAKTILKIGTPDDISTFRTEYTRMRDAAQKRVNRLREKYPDTVGAKQKYYTGKVDAEGKPIYKPGFPRLRDIDPRDLPKAFAELAKFLKAKGSTVTGQRQIKEKTIKTWNDEDVPLTNTNYNQAIKILEEARKLKLVYDSEKIVALADAMLTLDDSRRSEWLANLADLLPKAEQIKAIPELKSYSMDELKKMIGV